MNPLRKRFDDYGCDKGAYHEYDFVYYPDTVEMRHEEINILEVGVSKGNSIKAWLDYFDKASVYCIDIFARFSESKVDILNHPRVHHLKWNSTHFRTGNAVKETWGNDIDFDIIIDDGAHNPRDQRRTFLNLWPFLKPTGIYYVEDFVPEDTYDYCEKKWRETNGKVLPDPKSDKFSELRYNQFYTDISKYTVTKYPFYKITNRTGNCLIKIQHPSTED